MLIVALLAVGRDGKEVKFKPNAFTSDKPPCVQASAPVLAGIVSWATLGLASNASNSKVISLARGGGGVN